jgi:cysteine desulfurase
LEKLTNSYYFDYNATSPLSPSVEDYLERGDFLFANPSSQYQLGKKSRSIINSTKDFLFNTFSLDESINQIFFHSGATEGINTLLFGAALKAFKENSKLVFYFSPTDHACVVNLKENLSALGHDVIFMPINAQGEIKASELIKEINRKKADRTIINWTWLNNETGVVNSLSAAEEIKRETNTEIIVDAVQAPGKVLEWRELSAKLDAYSFSSHKFGGLKGVGFSFVKDSYDYSPLIIGGGQQNKLRSGTENPMGVYTTELAIRDLIKEFSLEKINKMQALKKDFEKIIISKFGQGSIVGHSAEFRNINTINFIIPSIKATLALMAFDLEGIQVSSGSACSSGANIPSRILTALKIDDKLTRSGVRLSFSKEICSLSSEEKSKLLLKFEEILNRYKN